MGEFTLTPQEIVTTARTLVEEGGPEAFTVRRLASALYCAPPAIYRRIGDKAALYEMLRADIVTDVIAAVCEADDADPLARYALGIQNFLDWCQTHPHLASLYLREFTAGPVEIPEALLQYIISMRSGMAQWGYQHSHTTESVDPELAINIAVGAIARLAALHRPDTEEFRRGVVNVFRLALVDSGAQPVPAATGPVVDLSPPRSPEVNRGGSANVEAKVDANVEANGQRP